jgi:hypothetical protein
VCRGFTAFEKLACPVRPDVLLRQISAAAEHTRLSPQPDGICSFGHAAEFTADVLSVHSVVTGLDYCMNHEAREAGFDVHLVKSADLSGLESLLASES